MERKQFTFYRSYLDGIQHLPPEEQGAILAAICQYALNGAQPEGLSPVGTTAFVLIKPTLDAGRRKAKAGRTGGKAEAKSKANDKQTASKPQASSPQANPKQDPASSPQAVPKLAAPPSPETAAKHPPSKKEGEKEKEGEIEIEKEKEIENECYKERTPVGVPKKNRFSPPTVAEVRDYCRQHGYQVDPQRFVDHYTAKGWVIGKSPMRDWQAAVRTWVRQEGPAPPEAKSGTDNIFLAMLREETG